MYFMIIRRLVSHNMTPVAGKKMTSKNWHRIPEVVVGQLYKNINHIIITVNVHRYSYTYLQDSSRPKSTLQVPPFRQKSDVQTPVVNVNRLL